jgi:hypothetical protein
MYLYPINNKDVTYYIVYRKLQNYISTNIISWGTIFLYLDLVLLYPIKFFVSHSWSLYLYLHPRRCNISWYGIQKIIFLLIIYFYFYCIIKKFFLYLSSVSSDLLYLVKFFLLYSWLFEGNNRTTISIK